MIVHVCFHSYFKDLTGTAEVKVAIPEGSTLAELHEELAARFPSLRAMRRSTLTAVEVDYQGDDYLLREGDNVFLFPPVQGG